MTVAHAGATSYGLAALSAIGQQVANARTGARNVTLFEAARSAGQLLGGEQLGDDAEVASFLVELGTAVGLPEPEVRRQVRNGIALGRRAPRRPLRSTPAAPARDELGALATYRRVWRDAFAEPGGGRSRATTLRIVSALCLCGVRSGSDRFRAGHRLIADLSGTSPGTVTKHLVKLEPWFERTDAGDRDEGTSSTWVLNGNTTGTEPTREHVERLFPFHRVLLDPGHAAWHRWSIGWRLFCLLADGVTSVADLAERMGVSARTVRGHLRRLDERCLATPTPAGWVACFDRFDESSVAHVAVERAERRRRERIQYLHYLVWQSEVRATRERLDPRTGEVLPPGKRIVLGPDLFLSKLPGFWREVLVGRPCRRPGSVTVAEMAARFRFCQEHREYVARALMRRSS
jgi:DNA-binding transcriptional ArsR family regulator